MNVIANRPEARWLPSRHRFALARLIAYAKLRGAHNVTSPAEHLILPIDRDQNSAEINSVAVWVFVTTVCYIAAALPLNAPVAIAVAIPIAAILIHFPIVVIGPIVRMLRGDRDNIKIISVITMLMLLMASAYYAVSNSWARSVAWFFFAVVIVNAAAAVVVWLLRGGIRAAEKRCAR